MSCNCLGGIRRAPGPPNVAASVTINWSQARATNAASARASVPTNATVRTSPGSKSARYDASRTLSVAAPPGLSIIRQTKLIRSCSIRWLMLFTTHATFSRLSGPLKSTCSPRRPLPRDGSSWMAPTGARRTSASSPRSRAKWLATPSFRRRSAPLKLAICPAGSTLSTDRNVVSFLSSSNSCSAANRTPSNVCSLYTASWPWSIAITIGTGTVRRRSAISVYPPRMVASRNRSSAPA